MEFHQQVQNRIQQTIPVINNFAQSLTIDKKTPAVLTADITQMDTRAQARDMAVFASDEAVRSEFAGALRLRKLVIKIPPLIEALLGGEGAVVDSLDAVYGVVPRTTESIVERAQALSPIWRDANAVLAARTPPGPAVALNNSGVSDMEEWVSSQPGLKQGVEDTAHGMRNARNHLRSLAVEDDKIIKRYYKAMAAMAEPGSAFAEALQGIDTESSNLPPTLSIAKVLQGGTDQLHALVSYDTATFDDTLQNKIEWMVTGTDADFTHSVAADPSGNALGPFAVGQTVKIRTRVSNANGTTTGSVRTLTMLTPVV